jgi:hypothetical protein
MRQPAPPGRVSGNASKVKDPELNLGVVGIMTSVDFDHLLKSCVSLP